MAACLQLVMAPGISGGEQYIPSTADLHDSPRLAMAEMKPQTPPPIIMPVVDRTPPSKARGPTGQAPQRQISYTSMKRDILYGAINEFQLVGSRLSAYDDLLTRLNFDLTPTVSQGHTWFSCRGRRDDRSACHRMVPEVYFRTAVGKLLKSADKQEIRGDDLIEELAAALSYAICSEHNRNIHKVVRAIKFLPVVQQWREERLSRATTPITTSSALSSKASSIKDAPVSEAASTASPATIRTVDTPTEEPKESPLTRTLDVLERLKLEKPAPDFLREAHPRGRRSASNASANTTTSTSSNRSKSVDRRLAERLGFGK